MRVTLGPRQLGVVLGLFFLQGALLLGMCLYVLHQSGPSMQLRIDDLQAQLDALRHHNGAFAAPDRQSQGHPIIDLPARPVKGYFEHNSSYIPQHKDSVILVMAKTSCDECNFQGWSDNCVFVHSLRRTGYTGDVVFFLNNINEKLAKQFDSFNISYILTKGRYNLDGYDLDAVGLGSKPRADVLNFHSSVFRYLLYDLFLRDYGDYYNRVMFTDVRDVLFQLDPFVWDEHPQWGTFEDKVYFFGEDTQNSAGWNHDQYTKVYRRAPEPEVATKAVLCSGTTMGTVAKARLYLSVFLPQLAHTPDHLFGYDQAIHNHIIYTGLLPADSFKIFYNRAGPVRTVGLEGGLPPLVNGLILLPDQSKVNVVHQWTRIPMYDDGSVKTVYGCPLQSVGF